jgi:nitroreductase/ferredoxin
MSLIQVDTEKCTRCGACAADCPVRILDMTDDGPVLPSANEEMCIACGHCVAICPFAALDHAAMAAQACPDLDKDLRLDARRTEQFLRSRRSIRRYRKSPVEPELLDRLVRLATYAPSGHNSQPLHWLVISGSEEVQALAALVREWMRRVEKEQPKTFELLRMDRILDAATRGEDRVLRGAPHLIVVHAPKDNRFAAVASATALAYLELAAPSLGLGTCWAGYLTSAVRAFPPLQEALRLPEGHEIHGAAMVGQPATGYFKMPLRQDPRITWRGENG